MDEIKLAKQQKDLDTGWSKLAAGDAEAWTTACRSVIPEELLKHGEVLVSELKAEVIKAGNPLGDCWTAVVHDNLRGIRDRCRVAQNPRAVLLRGMRIKADSVYTTMYAGIGKETKI